MRVRWPSRQSCIEVVVCGVVTVVREAVAGVGGGRYQGVKRRRV